VGKDTDKEKKKKETPGGGWTGSQKPKVVVFKGTHGSRQSHTRVGETPWGEKSVDKYVWNNSREKSEGKTRKGVPEILKRKLKLKAKAASKRDQLQKKSTRGCS